MSAPVGSIYHVLILFCDVIYCIIDLRDHVIYPIIGPTPASLASEEKTKRPSVIAKLPSNEHQPCKSDFSILKIISNGAYG